MQATGPISTPTHQVRPAGHSFLFSRTLEVCLPTTRLVALGVVLLLAACEPAIVNPETTPTLEAAFSNHGGNEYADVMNQGGIGIYALDGAHIVRQPNGLRASVKMPTPQSGQYLYPPNPAGIIPGHPEVFTLWMFAFNHPELCTDGICGGDDIGAGAAAKGSAYNIGGHVTGGGSLNISGRVGVGQPAGAPPGIVPTPLTNPAGAEIHLAVTSHGALDPSKLPNEFSSPTGSPACGCWWAAVFE